ncbi:MAG: molybdenum cofactor biosynthesis protein MoaE [Rubellimicrobium sp.]|nr:molybdenum cofactor biosynthesis protein MoaE [Rubellimicrobium sp.]
MAARVQSRAFDPGAELSRFTAGVAGAGAVVSFTGVVRDVAPGMVAMEIEHYPAMTLRAIEAMIAEAVARFGLTGAEVVHRHGRLEPGAVIMMVLTAAPHRQAAFQGAEFLMDWLKSRAPFWKKEITRDGAAWVAAKDDDEDALARW